MPEFTGERVIPGLVDADLYNEHLARYEFAARLVEGGRVLDAGCGSGYGSAVLASRAASVTAIDFSEEAVTLAREMFAAANLEFQVGNCSSLPPGPFDVIVAFEVIEHLADWRLFLQEARRSLTPAGRFFVSTPNKAYYAESRGEAGANPFHVHEFTFEEFQAELRSVFPHVGMFLQNHIGGVAITPVESGRTDFRLGSLPAAPEETHFFLAICSLAMCNEERFSAAEGFIWIPGTGNVLREREHHIRLLAGEVALKTSELIVRNQEYTSLLEMFHETNQQLEEHNQWAMEARAESEARGLRIVKLQEELTRQQVDFAEIAAGYQSKVAELETESRAKTEWALEMESRLTQEIDHQSAELARCVLLLDQAEQTVIERTHWAQALQHERDYLESEAAALRARRWVKMGTRIGFVPQQR